MYGCALFVLAEQSTNDKDLCRVHAAIHPTSHHASRSRQTDSSRQKWQNRSPFQTIELAGGLASSDCRCTQARMKGGRILPSPRWMTTTLLAVNLGRKSPHTLCTFYLFSFTCSLTRPQHLPTFPPTTHPSPFSLHPIDHPLLPHPRDLIFLL